MTYAGKSRIPQPGRPRQVAPKPVNKVTATPERQSNPSPKKNPGKKIAPENKAPQSRKTMPARKVLPEEKVTLERSHNRITGKEFEDESLPRCAYRDVTGRPHEHRIILGQVQRLLARDTHARVLQTGEQLLVTYNHTQKIDGEAALAESAAVGWPTVTTVHLLDSTGTLNQHLHVGPATTPVPFHKDERQFVDAAGEALESHNGCRAFKGGVIFKSWAQIAMDFNLLFEGQIPADDYKPRPWRSRQELKDEYCRLKNREAKAKIQPAEGRFWPRVKTRDAGVGEIVLEKPIEPKTTRKTTSIPRAIKTYTRNGSPGLEVLTDGYVRSKCIET